MEFPRKTPLTPGEPAPWFVCRCTSNERYHFNSVGGRYVVLSFLGSCADADSAKVLEDFRRVRGAFNDADACWFAVSGDPDDERLGRIREDLPGCRVFWDFDRAVAGAFGLAGDGGTLRKASFVLDPRLRVLALVPFAEAPERHVADVMGFLRQLPALEAERAADFQAPVLVVPYVFEQSLCRALVEAYERQGGADSGFMQEEGGRTVGVIDYGFKRRRDVLIGEERLRLACMARIRDRLAPELRRAFQFTAACMERHIVSCYDATEGGYFRPHRDNTTPGTAHRRFAVSLFLNSGEYEGGFLRFPEYGRRLYTAPAGGAVVFSCSLLHEATPVTRGRRYMYLPFLYDEAAARDWETYLRGQGGPA